MPLPVTSGISEIDIIENLAKESRQEEEQRYSTCQAASSVLSTRGRRVGHPCCKAEAQE